MKEGRMNDYNHMDWILHNTKGHTPAGSRWTGHGEPPLGLDIKWCTTDARHDADGTTQEIEANILLVKSAPLLLAEVKRLREENNALLSAIDMCIVTQMNSVEHGLRYQSGGCFEHYSGWEHEKESEEE